MSGPSTPFDAVPVQSEPPAPICPQCKSTDLLALGRVFANSSGVRGLYRCPRCTTEAWLRTTDRRGLPIAGRPSDQPSEPQMDLTQGTGVPLTNSLQWHSTLATDRPLYHDDTRCPEGGAIQLTDRRSGDGGRDPCEHCAGLLVQSIEATLPTSAGQ